MNGSAPQFVLGALAERFGLRLVGDPDHAISGVATLSNAQSGDLAFFANRVYRAQLAQTRAGVVLLKQSDRPAGSGNFLIGENPYADFAKIAALFEDASRAEAGAHPTALIAPTAVVHPSASVGPYCVIDDGARIGAGAQLGPYCHIGPHCELGADARLVSRVTLVLRARLGKRVLVHPGAVIGADGFGLANDGGRWIKVPQLGGVAIGDDCEIGANTTVDRGALEDTVLEQDVRLDNQVQIGHNVRVGAHTAMAGCAAVAGSARIGANCLIGGGAGVVGHIEICDGVTIAAKSLVTHSIRKPGQYASGTPLQDSASWRKNAVRFKQLDEMARQSRNKFLEEDS